MAEIRLEEIGLLPLHHICFLFWELKDVVSLASTNKALRKAIWPIIIDWMPGSEKEQKERRKLEKLVELEKEEKKYTKLRLKANLGGGKRKRRKLEKLFLRQSAFGVVLELTRREAIETNNPFLLGALLKNYGHYISFPSLKDSMEAICKRRFAACFKVLYKHKDGSEWDDREFIKKCYGFTYKQFLTVKKGGFKRIPVDDETEYKGGILRHKDKRIRRYMLDEFRYLWPLEFEKRYKK